MPTIDLPTKYGPFRCFEEDRWLSKSLKLLGEWSESELDYMRLFLELLASANHGPINLVDAGAFVGEHAIPLSKYVNKIYAFEPQKKVRDVLEHNIRMHGVKNIEVFPFALGDKPGTLRYPEVATNGDELVGTMMGSEGEHEVEVRTLDSFNLTPGFIKADIEGMELAMVYGALETLKRTHCPLLLEYDTVFQPHPPQLPEAMEMLGYQVRGYYFPIWNEGNHNGLRENPFGHTVSKMLLCTAPVNG